MSRMMNLVIPVLMVGMASAFALVASAADSSDQGNFLISAEWGALKRGWNAATLSISNKAGEPVEQLKIQLDYDMLAMPMNPPEAVISEIGDGQYSVKFFLGMRGAYRFNFRFIQGELTDTWVTEAGAR